MIRKLLAVASIYYTQRRWWLWIVVIGFYWCFLASGVQRLAADIENNAYDLAQLTPLVIFAILSPLVGTLAKWQFAHYRASVTPGFALPHLLLLGGPFLLFGLIVPTWFAFGSGASWGGLLAYAGVLTVVLAWAQGPSGSLVFAVWILLVNTNAWPRLTEYFLAPQDPLNYTRWPLAIFTWILIVVRLATYARLCEEDDGYDVMYAEQPNKRDIAQKAAQRRQLRRQFRPRRLRTWFVDRRLAFLANYRATTTGHQRKLLALTSSVVPIWLSVLGGSLAAPLYFLGFHFLTKSDWPTDEMSSFVDGMLVLFSIILIPIAVHQLVGRRPLMSTELLLPHSRHEYISALFRSVALTIFGYSFVMIADFIVIKAIIDPGWITWGHIACGTTALIAGDTLGMGFSLLVLLTNLAVERFILLLLDVLLIAIAVVGVYYVGEEFGVIAGLLLGAAVAGFGCLVIRTAHRQWLQAELG